MWIIFHSCSGNAPVPIEEGTRFSELKNITGESVGYPGIARLQLIKL
jgi:hypothetical protein